MGIGMMKIVVFIFNIILTLLGVGTILAGAFILTTMADFNRIAESDLVKLAIVLIFAGAIVTLVSFVGCLGALRESYLILMVFLGLLISVFIMELTIGIYAAASRANYKVEFKETLSDSIKRAQSEGKDRNYWDVLQRQFSCCGVDGPKDWGNKRPISCCLDKGDRGCSNSEVYHQLGCYDELVTRIHENTMVIAFFAVGIAFAKIVGMFLACMLANMVRSDSDDIIKIRNGRDLGTSSDS